MSCIISLLVGIVIGVPFGWALLFCAIDFAGMSNRRPPTKDEWKLP